MLRRLSLALALLAALILAAPVLAQDDQQFPEESFSTEDLETMAWLPERYVRFILRTPWGVYVKFTDGTHAILTEEYGAYDLVGALTTCKAHNIPVKLWDNNGGALTMIQIGSD
jgi:hypothetical protein